MKRHVVLNGVVRADAWLCGCQQVSQGTAPPVPKANAHVWQCACIVTATG